MIHGGIRLGAMRTEISVSAKEADRLQAQFFQRHFVRLPGLLAQPLFTSLSAHLDTATFRPAMYEDVGSDLRMAANGALEALHLATNDDVFLRFVERLTQCRPLGVFAGRIYRMIAGAGHQTGWHDDLFGDRRIGMSINLSSRPYCGGVFQLRRLGQEHLLAEVGNTGPGDAIVFRLAGDLEHRVTPVEGAETKTAFAGWFRPGPSYREAAVRNAAAM